LDTADVMIPRRPVDADMIGSIQTAGMISGVMNQLVRIRVYMNLHERQLLAKHVSWVAGVEFMMIVIVCKVFE